MDTQQYYAKQKEEWRQEHIAIVRDALVAKGWRTSGPAAAEVAIDALLAEGVVFARMRP